MQGCPCQPMTAMQVPKTLGHHADGAFVILVGPGAADGLALTLQSLAVNVLSFHPRHVILFYGAEAQCPAVREPNHECIAAAPGNMCIHSPATCA